MSLFLLWGQPFMTEDGLKWCIWDPVWVHLDPFGPFQTKMNGRPQSKKKAHHQVSYVWPTCGTPISTFWYINMVAIYEKCQK